MKKIEASIDFLSKNLDLFQCPKCKEEFSSVEGNQLKCEGNHTFDISKKGTVHFLLQESNSQYTKEMLIARSNIAQIGFWKPILDEIYSRISNLEGNHLDVGCGEGSHLNYLIEQGLAGNNIGFDISKEGVKLAASQYRSAFWCVADLADSPFSEKAFSSIFNIFSPSNYKEFERLLSPQGQIFKVVPTENYLKELRGFLYGESKEYSNENVIGNFKNHYPDSSEVPINYTLSLSKNQIADFAEMTPLVWDADQEKIHELLDQDSMDITIDVRLLIGEKV